MYFIRYEIREYYVEDNDFTYTPRDTLAQARAYAKENHIHSTENIRAGIYRVKMYPNSESAELIEKL